MEKRLCQDDFTLNLNGENYKIFPVEIKDHKERKQITIRINKSTFENYENDENNFPLYAILQSVLEQINKDGTHTHFIFKGMCNFKYFITLFYLELPQQPAE